MNTQKSGIGFVGLLTIAFIVLKLANIIQWEWVWVLSPLWISLGLGLAILLIFAIGMLIAYIAISWKQHARKVRR